MVKTKSVPVKSALAKMIDEINENIGPISGSEILNEISSTNNDTHIASKNSILQRYQEIKDTETITEVDPILIKNWHYHDRLPEDYGDLDSFATELKEVGQVQPCIVRPCNEDGYKFEVIVGERRWRAAKIAGIKLKVVVRELNDHDSALSQAVENSTRKNISEYARGISYANLVEKDVITQKDLQATLKLSQSSIRNLLSYSKIHADITKAIGSLVKVSPATAYEITRLQSKGKEYIAALIELSNKVKSGTLGHTKLEALIEEKITKKTSHEERAIPVTKNGRHIFTWRKDSNGHKSIAFPRMIRELINYDAIEKKLIEEIHTQLSTIEN